MEGKDGVCKISAESLWKQNYSFSITEESKVEDGD